MLDDRYAPRVSKLDSGLVHLCTGQQWKGVHCCTSQTRVSVLMHIQSHCYDKCYAMCQPVCASMLSAGTLTGRCTDSALTGTALPNVLFPSWKSRMCHHCMTSPDRLLDGCIQEADVQMSTSGSHHTAHSPVSHSQALQVIRRTMSCVDIDLTIMG